ncbi:MAG: ABC transporter substrate-binding protein [Fusobacteriaceae bacterium]
MRKTMITVLLLGIIAGCGSEKQEVIKDDKILTLNEIIEKAKEEGKINSVGMPDNWANWKETWSDLEAEYGLKHLDTDMSSAQEISKFKSEGKNASADIGDIGFDFTDVALNEKITVPYKTSYWDDVPEWAKDEEGHWILAYTGTIAFIIDKDQIKEEDIPRSWKELKESKYKVSIGEVGLGAQQNAAVLAAAYALGGNEKEIGPAIEYFSDIAKEGRLSVVGPTLQNLEKGEVQVGIIWDFNALSYRDVIDKERFEVLIPRDGSLTSGYSTIINKWAKNLNAAKLTREYILSDKGQINLAKGNARPIRNVVLPDEIKNKMIPNEQYKNTRPVKDFSAWKETSKKLAAIWQEEVLMNIK